MVCLKTYKKHIVAYKIKLHAYTILIASINKVLRNVSRFTWLFLYNSTLVNMSMPMMLYKTLELWFFVSYTIASNFQNENIKNAA